MSRRCWVVIVLGLGALGTIGGMAPWVYRRIRIEQVIARLEAGDDAAARAELVEIRGIEQAGERLAEVGEEPVAQLRVVDSAGKLVFSNGEWLAANLAKMAREGRLHGTIRRRAFDLSFPIDFCFNPIHDGSVYMGVQTFEETSLMTVRAQDSLWEFVDSGIWGERLAFARSDSGVELYVQYFLTGDRPGSTLVYQRDTWVVHPMGPNGPLLDASGVPVGHLDSIDATDIPDPIGLFPRRSVMVILPSGESALELRLASMGTWRQFVPGRKLYDGSIAHAVYLDRSAEKKDPFLLGYVGVSATTALGKWFAEDAVLKKPLENLDRGAHWISFHVPRDAAKLEPLAKFTLLFRPSPSFAERNGFQVSATECQPFERTLYLPLLEK